LIAAWTACGKDLGAVLSELIGRQELFVKLAGNLPKSSGNC
jgi:hypothetical protein